jgi:serine/threonine protein kinase
MKPINLLSINVDLVNTKNLDDHTKSFQLEDTTFRHDGVSIGLDYLRLDGDTLTRGELLPGALTYQQVIGKGAFSTVQRALWKRKTGSTIPVAVKEFLILDASDQRRKMMIHELKALSRVENPTLVRLYGAFLCRDKATMVLELMDHGSLDTFLARTNEGLEEAIIAPIAYHILMGLADLHNLRIVHRDLKPANILLHSDGSVKLCDFGMASLGEQSLNTTVLGTTKYMAPERLRAQPYGRLSDLWGFGLIVLECVTGKPPFQGVDSIVELVVTVEEMNFVDLLDVELQVGLREMILGSLQMKPGKSLRTAE